MFKTLTAEASRFCLLPWRLAWHWMAQHGWKTLHWMRGMLCSARFLQTFKMKPRSMRVQAEMTMCDGNTSKWWYDFIWLSCFHLYNTILYMIMMLMQFSSWLMTIIHYFHDDGRWWWRWLWLWWWWWLCAKPSLPLWDEPIPIPSVLHESLQSRTLWASGGFVDVDVLLDVGWARRRWGWIWRPERRTASFDRFSRHLGLGPTSKRNGEVLSYTNSFHFSNSLHRIKKPNFSPRLFNLRFHPQVSSMSPLWSFSRREIPTHDNHEWWTPSAFRKFSPRFSHGEQIYDCAGCAIHIIVAAMENASMDVKWWSWWFNRF